MDADRFDTLARSLTDSASRRRLLAGLSGGLLASITLTATREPTQAKKKKTITICVNGQTQKTKKKGFQTRFPGATVGACTSPPKPTCAASCGATCSTCYERITGQVLCGGVASALCEPPCRSDNDCLGTDRPYCTKSFTDRATGETSDWGCPAACTNVAPCGA